MPSRDDEERVRHRPPWEGQAPPRADEGHEFQPWQRKSGYDPSSTDQKQGTAFGSGGWGGGYGPETPSGYGGPSGTGYGQTSQGQSGYGSSAFRPAGPGPGGRAIGTRDDKPTSGARPADGAGAMSPIEMAHSRPDWHDVDYQQWRDEQLRQLDHDYLTWRQVRYRKFADEFSAWRSSQQDTAGAVRTETPIPASATSHPTAPDASARVPPSSSQPQ